MSRLWQKDLKNLDNSFTNAVDVRTNNLTTVTYFESEIHNGNAYYIGDFTTKASGEKVDYFMTAPATSATIIHLQIEARGSGDTTFQIFRGASGVTGASVVTPEKNDQNSVKNSSLQVVASPTTIATTGAQVFGTRFGTIQSTAHLTRGEKLLLESGETYLLRLTSNAATNRLSWHYQWVDNG